MGKAYGLNTQVLLANLQHFCNNNIIILNYYYFIPGLFPSHSWWAESCSVSLSRGMVCSRQPQSFQGVHPHGRPDGWTEGGWWDGWRDARIQGRLHFSSRRPLLYVITWPIGPLTSLRRPRIIGTGLPYARTSDFFLGQNFVVLQHSSIRPITGKKSRH